MLRSMTPMGCSKICAALITMMLIAVCVARFMKQVENRLQSTPIAPYEHFPLQEPAFQFARSHEEAEILRQEPTYSARNFCIFPGFWPRSSLRLNCGEIASIQSSYLLHHRWIWNIIPPSVADTPPQLRQIAIRCLP